MCCCVNSGLWVLLGNNGIFYSSVYSYTVFCQQGTRSTASWFYSYGAIFCLSVCPFVHGLGSPGNEPTALASLFASLLQSEAKRCQFLSTAEAQLSLHKHNIVKEPQKRGNAKKSRSKNWCYSTMCPMNKLHLHDPVDSQRQLECISPLVGRPTTCMVIRTYLVPACTSPAG